MKVVFRFLVLLFFLIGYSSYGQIPPQSFKYQAAIRDNNGNLLANKLVAIKVTILQLIGPTYQVVYGETFNESTNDFGIVNLNIGTGKNSSGPEFSTINWSAGPFSLRIDLDVNNGNNYLFMGTSQILAVPYANYAAKSGNADNDFDRDSLNEIQQISLNVNQLQLNKFGGIVNLDKYIDNTDSQSLSIANKKLSISNGNFINLSDNDSINEIQNLSLIGDQLQLSKNGGAINLSKYTDNTDSQTLTLQGTNLSISRGNTITLSGVVDLDSDPTNEIQTLSYNKDSLRLSKANYILLPKDNDADSTNEIQTISIIGNKLMLSKSNQVNLDADTTNEIQTLIKTKNQLSLSKSNQVNIDGDTMNEIQILSVNNDSLSLSKSNRIYMPGVPVGSILAFGGRNIPSGWLLCDGREISRANYVKLFNTIDSVWGAGNSISTFNLPDLRGQFLRGVNGNSNVDQDTTSRIAKYSGGNNGNNIGSFQNDTIKSHNHSIPPNYVKTGGSTNYTNGLGQPVDIYNSYPTGFTGGSETRPKNAYVYYIIKY